MQATHNSLFCAKEPLFFANHQLKSAGGLAQVIIGWQSGFGKNPLAVEGRRKSGV
jgi:hypothetical protein